MTAASPLGDDLDRQNRARSTVSALEHFHKIKTTVVKPIPHSLQLLLILNKNGKVHWMCPNWTKSGGFLVEKPGVSANTETLDDKNFFWELWWLTSISKLGGIYYQLKSYYFKLKSPIKGFFFTSCEWPNNHWACPHQLKNMGSSLWVICFVFFCFVFWSMRTLIDPLYTLLGQ